jgi:hypothetical protein
MERLYAARQTGYALAQVHINAGLAPAEEIAERVLDRLNLV